jgi:hypothetical protein
MSSLAIEVRALRYIHLDIARNPLLFPPLHTGEHRLQGKCRVLQASYGAVYYAHRLTILARAGEVND